MYRNFKYTLTLKPMSNLTAHSKTCIAPLFYCKQNTEIIDEWQQTVNFNQRMKKEIKEKSRREREATTV
jgi:hypothetical protein